MNDRVRLGVIGLNIGLSHAQRIAALDETELVAGCDLRADLAGEIQALGGRFHTDFRRMLDAEKLDGVVLSVPNHLHAPMAIECLERGVPVLLEKPIAASMEDAKQIVAAVDRRSMPLLVGHHRRFSRYGAAARDWIAQGKLGQLVGANLVWTLLKPTDYYKVQWRTTRATGGGHLLINLVHTIDDLRYITRREVTRVYAETSSHVRDFEVEDVASISLRLEGDALVSILSSDCTPSIWSYEGTTGSGENANWYHTPEDCYYFFGTQGALTLPRMRFVHYPDATRQGWQCPVQIDQLGVVPEDPLRLQMSHFARVVRKEEAPRTTARDAARTLQVLLGIFDSRDTGRPIDLA